MVGRSIFRNFVKYNPKYLESKNILIPDRTELDLCNFSETEKWFKFNKPDVVIMAAAKVGGIIANYEKPYDFILNNLKIQTNLIELSYKYKIKKLIFLGSSCIYPKFAEQPIKEESLLTGELEKTNEFYSIAKIAGIKLCQSLSLQHGFKTICLMPTNLYGPNDNYNITNSHVMASLIQKFFLAKEQGLKNVTCWGTGNVLREFLYVDDLADACNFLVKNFNSVIRNSAKSDGSNFCLLNVGSGEEITIKRLALKIASIVEYKGEIHWDKSKPDGTPRKKLDIQKLTNLNWKSKTNIDDGIKLTLDYFKRERAQNILRI